MSEVLTLLLLPNSFKATTFAVVLTPPLSNVLVIEYCLNAKYNNSNIIKKVPL